jgi:uncharacterized protein (DUF1015 family)
VFPTHRLLKDFKDPARQEALGATLKELFDIEPVDASELRPPDGAGPLTMGYIDAHFLQPYRLTLKDQAIAERALPGMPPAYQALDTAVLEAIVLKEALGMTEDDISHFNGLDYARSTDEARERIESGDVDAGFFMRGTPVSQVRDVAAAGENMPPKSTYFFPKVLTGLVFHRLAD